MAARSVRWFPATRPPRLSLSFSSASGCSARLALASGGDPGEALTLALGVAADAAGRHALRYELLAEVVAAQARAVAGETVDRDGVDALLRRLDAVAATEVWWTTAQLAAGLEAGPAVTRRLDLIRTRRGR